MRTKVLCTVKTDRGETALQIGTADFMMDGENVRVVIRFDVLPLNGQAELSFAAEKLQYLHVWRV